MCRNTQGAGRTLDVCCRYPGTRSKELQRNRGGGQGEEALRWKVSAEPRIRGTMSIQGEAWQVELREGGFKRLSEGWRAEHAAHSDSRRKLAKGFVWC